MNLKMEVVLDKPYKLDLETDLSVDKVNINRELGAQPSLFAWYGMLYELARKKSAALKRQHEMMHARLSLKFREEAQQQNIKVTEGMLESLIETNEEYRKVGDAYQDSKYEEGVLFVAKEAFIQRKDMLISLASNMRQEIDDDIQVSKDKVREIIKRQPNKQ